jgi:copper chaperone CopZ
MKSISKILVIITVLLSSINTYAQINNTKTETVNIYGECDMCKKTIEKAGNSKNVAQVEWNVDTKKAIISYDTQKTSREEILKRITLAGYDSEDFLAPADVYIKLPECCQYTRELKTGTKTDAMLLKDHNEMSNHAKHDATTKSKNPLQAVVDSYFSVKDALIKTDAAATSTQATVLLSTVKAVDMNTLSSKEHDVWMKGISDLTAHVESISKSKSVPKQRELFANVSKTIYDLAKVSKLESPIYYQHCPMFNAGKGAHWLSKDSDIKNPYFGSKMLTCGSTVETLN